MRRNTHSHKSNANFPKNNCKLADSYEANDFSFLLLFLLCFSFFYFFEDIGTFSFFRRLLHSAFYYLFSSLHSFIWKNDVTNCKVPTSACNSYHFSMSVIFSGFHSSGSHCRSDGSSNHTPALYDFKKFSSLLQSFPLLYPPSLLLSFHIQHAHTYTKHECNFHIVFFWPTQCTPYTNFFFYCRQFKSNLHILHTHTKCVCILYSRISILSWRIYFYFQFSEKKVEWGKSFMHNSVSESFEPSTNIWHWTLLCFAWIMKWECNLNYTIEKDARKKDCK